MARLLAWLVLALCQSVVSAGENWPQFRGPDGQGHADAAGLPIEWSESRNIAWKTALPGEGWSSPVIWGERIWMTAALDHGKSLHALCVDRSSGRLVHNVEVFRVANPASINAKNSYASPSPVIEEGRLYVHFGTYGTACLASDSGKMLWKNDELHLDHKEGPGSSPILFEDFLIVNCDGMDVQFVVALDKHTGRIAWKTNRSGEPDSDPDRRKAYSTPLIVSAAGRDQLISTGANQVISYDPRTGAEWWKVRFKGFSNVARPIVSEGLVLVTTDFARPQLWAIRPDGSGDVSETHVVWRIMKQAGGNPSPLAVGTGLYMVTNRGVGSGVDARTGEILWTERLGGDYSASPLAADGRVYISSEEGTTFVLEPGSTYKLLATNQLEGRIMASAAVAGRAIYLRTDTHLYRIENRTVQP
jgi:outer membrane protein assembly factor BamB